MCVWVSEDARVDCCFFVGASYKFAGAKMNGYESSQLSWRQHESIRRYNNAIWFALVIFDLDLFLFSTLLFASYVVMIKYYWFSLALFTIALKKHHRVNLQAQRSRMQFERSGRCCSLGGTAEHALAHAFCELSSSLHNAQIGALPRLSPSWACNRVWAWFPTQNKIPMRAQASEVASARFFFLFLLNLQLY